MFNSLQDDIVKTIEQAGTASVREIMDALAMDYRDPREREKVNSLLYGELRSIVIRDKNEDGLHTWRIKTRDFEAAKGLEIMFYTELTGRSVVDEEEISLDTKIENRRKRKVYHLDIAITRNSQRYNIEIDGFEHIRADALLSIQEQIAKKEDVQVDIDWMDHESSYVNYQRIDRKPVYQWLNAHPNWCIRYHEELLWPHDLTRNIWLIENGWRIIRFWNFEVKNEMDRCMQDVKALLKG